MLVDAQKAAQLRSSVPYRLAVMQGGLNMQWSRRDDL